VDDTLQIAQACQQKDSRIKVITKQNGGVASARNAGIAASSGEMVAFVDADDLWHPTKIAKQMALLTASGADTALVYVPFRRIDMQGRVLSSSRNHRVEGWVINRHFYVNIIGNGSSILARKHVLESWEGYSSVLQQQGAQGCEDMLLQLRIALRYRFATVPEYLVGYRQSPGNMSSNEERMLRSSLLALSMVLAECPGFAELPQHGLLARKIWDYLKVIQQPRYFTKGMQFIAPYLRGRTGAVAKAAWIDAAAKLGSLYRFALRLPAQQLRRQADIPYRHFYDYDPADMNFSDHMPTTREQEEADEIYRNLILLAPLDAAYRPEKYFGNRSVYRMTDGGFATHESQQPLF